MAVTSTQSKVPGSTTNVAYGRYLDTGTAAAFTITCGFKPRYVRVTNVGATGLGSMEWQEGMADASAVLTVSAGTRTVITTLGITPLSYGFTVGLQLNINIIAEQLNWEAIG